MSTVEAPTGRVVRLPTPYLLPEPPSAWRSALATFGLPTLSAAEKAYKMYGGSTMNWALDGARRWFLGCNAIDSATDTFAFYVFVLQAEGLVNVPLPVTGGGRGWMDVPPNGMMYYGAWDGSSYVPNTGPALVPGAVPWTPATGYTTSPNGAIRVFVDTDGFDGKRLINLAGFGIPPCQALNVRLAINGEGGRIFRCGAPTEDPNLQTASMLTVTALGPNARAYESGILNSVPSRTLVVMTENGAVGAAFVDITGWW